MEQTPAVALFFALGMILLASRLGGALARWLGQPRVLGELIVGVVLGPTALDLLHSPLLGGINLQVTITQLAELGVLLLMFIIGLEVNIGELAQLGRLAGTAGVFGSLATVILSVGIALAFGYGWQPALFTGVALAATSVSISAQVLLELGLLRTKIGSALLATSLIDDVLALLLVSIAIALNRGSGGAADLGSLGLVIVRMMLYIGAAFALAWLILPRLIHWLDTQPSLKQSYGIPAVALLLALLFGWTAETLGGVAAITGAFIAGVGFSRARDQVRHEIEAASSSIAYTLLVPIFFINVGLATNLRLFPLDALPLALLLFVFALIAKVVGCGLGARFNGFSGREALQLGVCMIPRGEVGLIVASLGLTVGVFKADQPLYTALFLVIVLTPIITPLLVRQVFREANP
ncbi:MAG TPA: cation:proton antiporter [Phototrophicaceae bacterium]|nr:cation:proton antiporter [Phototrophicaceae bacterium]